ncbi:MAG: hypothetical protein ACRC8A_14605 [Microcoleaceae cyanobacterium]
MTPLPEDSLNRQIQIPLNAQDPALLDGLEAWLKLGLLTHEQVRSLCRNHLSQRLPLPQAQEQPIHPQLDLQPQRSETQQQTTATLDSQLLLTNLQTPNFITQFLQSFKAELSVRWLLFLGLLTVLVSSGVLAASQWDKFPRIGQYGILLTYTLGFFIATFWTRKQSRLQLTSETLRLVTLLLVPLNFLAIDRFGLWRNPLEWMTTAIAIVLLTGIITLLNQTERQISKQLIINQLGLSYLHLGWSIVRFPLFAVYSGAVLTATITGYQFFKSHKKPDIEDTKSATILSLSPLVFLVVRFIFMDQVDIAQIGLALAIISGLLYLNSSTVLHQLSYGLLLISWFVSAGVQPWQTLAINGIGLGIFIDRLSHFWQRRDLILIFLIGGQTYWLLTHLLPEQVRAQFAEPIINLTNTQNTPDVLISLFWFPYLVVIAGIADWLRTHQKFRLARFSDRIALGIGSLLTVISGLNPIVRSLNLFASTVALAIITIRRQPTNTVLIYLTHLGGLLTGYSLVHWFSPTLKLEYWGILLAVIAAIELGISASKFGMGSTSFNNTFDPISNTRSDSQQSTSYPSTWHFGLGLASLSYSLFLTHTGILQSFECVLVNCQNSNPWGISWLIIPTVLTLSASYSHRTLPRLVSELGFLFAGMAQLLTIGFPEARLISLGITTILLFVNSRRLCTQDAATITVGFGLGLIASLIWKTAPNLSPAGWFIAIAITGLLLLGIYHSLSQFFAALSPLKRLYQTAIDRWVVVLYGFELIGLTAYIVATYWNLRLPSLLIVIAIGLTLGAISYRNWNLKQNYQRAHHPGIILNLYAFGWAVELLVAEGLSFTDNRIFYLSVANIILGLLAQGLGEFWQRRHSFNYLPHPWQVLPLLYGIFGATLRSESFDHWTGLSMLGVALILLGVGRQSSKFKPLTYLGLAGVSLGVYQLLFYQILSFSTATQFVAVAALGAMILSAYQVLNPWLISFLNLTDQDIRTTAYLHWGFSSIALILATQFPMESSQWLALGTGYFLAQYAVLQGRHNSNSRMAEIWVYFGILEAIAILTYVSQLLTVQQIFLSWSGAIASGIAYFLYFLPWESWGWSLRPWRRIAIFLPIVTVVLTQFSGNTDPSFSEYISAIVATLFYLLLAQVNHRVRLTYFSVFLVNYIIFNWLPSSDYRLNVMAYTAPIGLSLLYLAQVDSILKNPEQKMLRHALRMVGIGIICITALLTNEGTGLISGIIGLAIVFAGLGLRIRAFLYVGTATFLVNIFNQMVILNAIYPFFKWTVGFIVGLILIWIAANFETRRERIVGLLQGWTKGLESWE